MLAPPHFPVYALYQKWGTRNGQSGSKLSYSEGTLKSCRDSDRLQHVLNRPCRVTEAIERTFTLY
jgi:hypothetical protein